MTWTMVPGNELFMDRYWSKLCQTVCRRYWRAAAV